jgi:CDP-diacylglycerol--glycerol-3-phosphate 3-phosphatidyltransferase
MHLAQYITFLRILLSPIALIYLSGMEYKTEILLGVVILGGFTDYVDGLIARKQGMTSPFGAILDYTADKVFVLSVLFVLSIAGDLAAWITFIFLFREIIVMGIRLYASHQSITISASPLGKLKTAMIFLAIVMLLANIPYANYVFYAAVFLAVVSFVEYTSKFLKAVE